MAKKNHNQTVPARTTSKARVIAGAILGLLLLALIGFGVWFILDRTNFGTEQFRAFAVTMDGEEIKTTKDKRSILCGEHTVSVSYLFDFLTDKTYDYNVDIVPRSGIRFNYAVNNKQFPWADQKDLSKAFQLKKEEKSFTFTVPENLAAVLAALYPDAEITAPKESELADNCIYTLVVSSYNENAVYMIDFSIAVTIDGVDTDKPEVQFP